MQWKRFTWHAQEVLCRKYKVILTDHVNRRRVGPMAPTPLRERIRSIPSKITVTNTNKMIDKTISGVNRVSDILDKLDGKNFKMFSGVSQKEYSILVGSEKKNYSGIMGKRTKRDYSFLTGK